MIQIIPNRKQFSFLESLGSGIERGMDEGAKRKQRLEEIAYEYGLKNQEKADALRGKQEENRKIVRALEKQHGKEPGEYEDFVSNPQMIPKPISEKNPLGGLGGKELSDEEINAIESTLKNNPEANPEELELELAKKKISPARSKPYVEARAESQNIKQKKYESDREFHTKISSPIIEKAQNIIKEAPIKKGLIAQQRRDIASGNTEGIIPYLVEQTGLEIYRKPEEARFKTVSKDRFVSNLSSLAGTARPNQFIEQQLVSAQPSLGRSAEANQTVLDLDEFIDDMKEQRARFELQLAEQDQDTYGYVKRDISERAEKLMKPYAERRQEQMAYTIRKRYEENLGDEELTKEIVQNKVPRGTPLTLRSARILMIMNNDDEKKATQAAKKMGFEIPSEETYMNEAK